MRRRICGWCGVRLSFGRRLLTFNHCRTCSLRLSCPLSGPPCRQWAYLLPEDIDLVKPNIWARVQNEIERT